MYVQPRKDILQLLQQITHRFNICITARYQSDCLQNYRYFTSYLYKSSISFSLLPTFVAENNIEVVLTIEYL